MSHLIEKRKIKKTNEMNSCHFPFLIDYILPLIIMRHIVDDIAVDNLLILTVNVCCVCV